MLVTRSTGTHDFGNDVKEQFSRHAVALWVVSGILILFALIPGLPFTPFLLLSIAVGFLGFQIDKKKKIAATEKEALPETTEVPEKREENYEKLLHVDLLQLEVGYGLIPFVDAAQDGELLNRIQSMRRQFAANNGFIVPAVHIRDNLQLNPNQYSLYLKGVQIATSEIIPDHLMAMDPGMVTEKISGIETTEPAFGLPALWISSDKRDRAQIAGYTVVDCTTVMATHISEIIKQHAHELLGRQEVQGLLDNLAGYYPKLVEELVPGVLQLGTIMKVLQNLMKEGVSIRDLRTILETLADYAPSTRDPDVMTEYVRFALARTISSELAVNGVIPVITLAKPVEDTIRNAVQHKDSGSFLSLSPEIAQQILDSIGRIIAGSNFGGSNRPTLLAAPQIRPYVRNLTERYYPALAVISHNEVTPDLRIQSTGTVTLDAHQNI